MTIIEGNQNSIINLVYISLMCLRYHTNDKILSHIPLCFELSIVLSNKYRFPS